MPTAKEAEHVYVLMTDEYRVSRNTRAQWYFNNLNQVIEAAPKTQISEYTNEIEVVSIVPLDYQDLDEDEPTPGPCVGLLTPSTRVTFFARRYRLVYILDLSPSMATVDTLSNKVLFEDLLISLERSLTGLSKPFYVPGSKFLFQPELFITVLAYASIKGEQVIAKGWKLTDRNLDSFLEAVKIRFNEITADVYDSIAGVNANKDYFRRDTELGLTNLFEDDAQSQNFMHAPDIAMVNMFRQGLLALQLLPPQSNAGLAIITDGMLNLPDAKVLENMLTHLRHSNTSCSFLQVGSNPHSHSCFGYLPYIDLMKFITQATFGAYMCSCPEPSKESNFSVYHRAFLAWSFQRALHGFKADANWEHCRTLSNSWSPKNPYFYSLNDPKSRFSPEYGVNKDLQPVRNKQIESSVATSFTNLLSCRLREGFTIKSVNITEASSQIQVTLVLPWKYNVNIEYQITAPWMPAKFKPDGHDDELVECRYEVTIEGSYSFLHDVTCQIKKPIKSRYRDCAIKQFCESLKSLPQSDQLLVHLSNFSREQDMAIPESIRSGNPLFYIAPNSSNLVLAAKNAALQQFSSYWRQICLLNINGLAVWQKWMHTHRINLILEHDMPLSKHLHVPNANGRYVNVQCRQAMASLSELLKNFSSFVMLENHSYVKFIDPVPNEFGRSFFMIRVITQLPCMVLHIAFIGGTPGSIRHKVVGELKESIKNSKFSKRLVVKTSESVKTHETTDASNEQPQKSYIEVNSCVIMRKPIDKILLRHEEIACEFSCSLPSCNSNQEEATACLSEQLIPTNLSILKRYMHQQRWYWQATGLDLDIKHAFSAINRVLSKLTKLRLEESFHFAYTSTGFINMVREIEMLADNDYKCPCVIQYVIFPPHLCKEEKLSEIDASGDTSIDATNRRSSKCQLITECWIEPQHGVSVGCTQQSSYLEGLNFKEIANAFFNIDAGVLAELFSPGKLSDQDGKSSKIGNERSSPNMSVDVGSLSVTNFTLDSTSSKNK